MCLSPIIRPNPYFSPDSVKVSGHASTLRHRGAHLVGMQFRKPDEQYIYVPCNVCPSCVAMRQNDIVQRAQVEARFCHVFFLTLTYNNEHLPRISVPIGENAPDSIEVPADFETGEILSEDDFEEYDFDSVSDPIYVDDLPETDEEIAARLDAAAEEFLAKKGQKKEYLLPDSIKSTEMAYANHHHLQDVIRHFRNDSENWPEFAGRSLKYLAVSELGGKKGRPHFHVLLFVEKLLSDYLPDGFVRPAVFVGLENRISTWWKKNWAVNVGTKKFPKYEPLYTYVCRPDSSSPTGFKTTFDCHYVDPRATDAGTDDVAFYVSKYIMKTSDKEIHRKVFLRAVLSESEFTEFWKIVRSRMLISKGFGTHADTRVNDAGRHYAHHDPEVLRRINHDCRKGDKDTPGPVFITDLGVHRPLSRYYFDKVSDGVKALTLEDVQFISDRFDRENNVPAYERGKEFVDRKVREFQKRVSLMESHEIL